MKDKTKEFIGVLTLSKREVLRYLVVSHQTIIPPLISSALFLFIFGLSVGRQIPFGEYGIPYLNFIIPGIITMYLISGSYENTSSSLFIARWHNHIQEVLLSPLSYMEMVTGLLIGGMTRGILVASGVFLVAFAIAHVPIVHPWITMYFCLSISVIFACSGLIAALWAKDFGTLTVWNTYLITPAVFLGGVFNPVGMLPESVRFLAFFNPMFYLVSGMRYGILGIEEASIVAAMTLSGVWALGMYFFTVYLFKIGYRLRT